MVKNLFASILAVWAAGVLWVPAARAQEEANSPEGCPPGMVEAPPPPVYQQPPPAPVVHQARPWSPANMSLTVGGGVTDFARSTLSNTTDVGGTWDVRYLLGTRRFFGFEAGYLGTAQGGNTGLAEGGVQTNQLTGSVRWNILRARVQPFVTAGVGWGNLRRNATNINDTITLSSSSNSFVAPFMGGIAGYIGQHGVIDIRGGYTLVANRDFSVFNNSEGISLNGRLERPDMWNAELRAGYAF
jgi:hypothetical protein